MPKFHVHLLSAAHGFHNACVSIDQLVANHQQEFVDLLTASYNSFDGGPSTMNDDKLIRYSIELQWIKYLLKLRKNSTPTPSIEDVRDALNCNTTLKPGSIDAIVSALDTAVADHKGIVAVHRQVSRAAKAFDTSSLYVLFLYTSQ